MGLDRTFVTPTVTVDQEKYDDLVIRANKYEETKEMLLYGELPVNKTSNLDFGQAIQLLKQGKKLQREGWNGKKQYIELATNISYKDTNGVIVNPRHDAIGNKAIAFAGTSGVQLGWLASQADMLAEDWKVVTEK